jgi:hypothetical protein
MPVCGVSLNADGMTSILVLACYDDRLSATWHGVIFIRARDDGGSGSAL